MRLIHTKTLALHEFMGDDVPIYIILSHCWGDEEVTFQEYQSLGNGDEEHDRRVKSKAGYKKILSFLRLAKLDKNIEYGWVDTCCIDKTSSAELSEAINSMYRWYADAAKCYAYLVDVRSAEDFALEVEDGSAKPFEQSRWFTRGWTLQELIAPYSVMFYSADWVALGSKITLAARIAAITGIDAALLKSPDRVWSYSVACRMSWVADRITTRSEDLAYCLMGIFDVNMPMLYGEGNKAFLRLQEEILKSSNDHSIFAWVQSPYDEVKTREPWLRSVAAAEFGRELFRDILGFANCDSTTGLLATSPKYFAGCGDYVPIAGQTPESLLVTQTNNGISLGVAVIEDAGAIKAVLNCRRRTQPDTRPCIRLMCRRLRERQFVRMYPHLLEDVGGNSYKQQIYVKQPREPQSIASLEPIKRQVFHVVIENKDSIQSLRVDSAWVSPQSYAVNGFDGAAPESSRSRWGQIRLAGRPEQSRGYNDALMAFTFGLPAFPETPALLIKSDLAEIVVGRARDGRVGLQEAPKDLTDALTGGYYIAEGRFLTNLEPSSESRGLRTIRNKNGAVLDVTVTKLATDTKDVFTVVIKVWYRGNLFEP